MAMRILVWIYRVLTLFFLFIFAANAIYRFVPLSLAGEIGRYLFVVANVALFLIVLIAGLTPKVSMKVVWTATFVWCLLFSWWAWIETQSSPFILHELHTFDPVAAAAEIEHFRVQAACWFSILLVWFLGFPVFQKHSQGRLERFPNQRGL
jgi:hypothetical protein